MVPTVSCETRMKEIELKEICIDIDIQLPREECKQEEREDCRSLQVIVEPSCQFCCVYKRFLLTFFIRFEPREVIVQRCEPTVRQCSFKPI